MQFKQTIYDTGETVYVTADIPGTFNWASGLFGQDGTWTANIDDTLNIGQANIGGYALNVYDASQGYYYYSWFTLLPDSNGKLVLEHFDNVPPAQYDQQPFSNNILLKYLNALTQDYLASGFKKAAANFPQELASVVGDTVVLAVVFFPVALAPFLIGSAAGIAVDFFAHVNEYVIDAMGDDGTLTQPEVTFLKLCFGLAAFTNGARVLFGSAEDIETAKSALDVFDKAKDLTSTGGEMDFGLHLKTGDSIDPSAAVIIHINQPPQQDGPTKLRHHQPHHHHEA